MEKIWFGNGRKLLKFQVGPPSVDGGRQQQWFERELIGLPRGCFPEDQPMSPLFLRMFSTR